MYTLEDIYNLPDGQRAELIDGAIYFMAPLDIRKFYFHFLVKLQITNHHQWWQGS